MAKKTKTYLWFLLSLVSFVLMPHFSFASKLQHETDSLLLRLKTDKEDTTRVNHYNSICWNYRSMSDLKRALAYGDSGFMLAQKLNFTKGMARADNLLASTYYVQGDYPKAMEYLIKALKIYEATENKAMQAQIEGNMGLIYKQEGDYPKAMEYYRKALKVHEDLDEKNSMASVNGNIGTLYENMHIPDSAIVYFTKAMNTYKELGDVEGIAMNTSNLGGIQVDKRNFPAALELYFKAIKLYEGIGDKSGIATDYENIGSLYIDEKNPVEAKKYILISLKLADSIGDIERVKVAYSNLGILSADFNQWKDAYEYYKKYYTIKDSLVNRDKSKEIGKLEAKADYDKQLMVQQADEDKKVALASAESKRQKAVIVFIGAIALAVAIIAVVIFRSLKVTRKQKVLIEEQKVEVENQKVLVEEKNKEVLDSITYAKRLQDAILPRISDIEKVMPESFVLYKPKDIVAGDFYWMEFIPTHPDSYRDLPSGGEGDNSGSFSPLVGRRQEGIVLIAAADCTGHGVPGALVSVVCSNALNRTVKEFKITEPGKILDKVRELVLETFSQRDTSGEKSESDVQDGMDISLCAISPLPIGEGQGVSLQWSGAYNPLWYIQNDELKEIVPDKQPIGKQINSKPFSTHTLKLNKGDTIYLFTDGYADQFGGPAGKKFKYAPFKANLLETARNTMKVQQEKLENIFENWKGFLEQVDDVLIIGIRV